jgi:hypothetical protein
VTLRGICLRATCAEGFVLPSVRAGLSVPQDSETGHGVTVSVEDLHRQPLTVSRNVDAELPLRSAAVGGRRQATGLLNLDLRLPKMATTSSISSRVDGSLPREWAQAWFFRGSTIPTAKSLKTGSRSMSIEADAETIDRTGTKGVDKDVGSQAQSKAQQHRWCRLSRSTRVRTALRRPP